MTKGPHPNPPPEYREREHVSWLIVEIWRFEFDSKVAGGRLFRSLFEFGHLNFGNHFFSVSSSALGLS
jgi:hypothetical protein